MTTDNTPDDMAKAIEIVAQIQKRVTNALAPLETEMRIMKWPPDYRRIVWEAVMREAQRRMGDG